MKYVEKHSLSETALIELFKRGNIVELFAYVIRHKLSDKVEFILSEIESDLLYDAYFFKEEQSYTFLITGIRMNTCFFLLFSKNDML